MAKQLRIIDRLLLGIAFIDEHLGKGYRLVQWIRSGPLDFWMPPKYRQGPLKQAVTRLLKAGYLEKRIVKGEPVLVIGNKGKLKVERKFSYFKLSQKRWDGYWRLVIFDIQEKDRFRRQKLRAKLKELGFGMWQKSIYISPHPLEEDMTEFLKEEQLFGKAYVLTAKHHLLGEARQLSEKVWDLNQLNQSYLQLEGRLDALKKMAKKKAMVKVKNICYDYGVLLTGDPCLPSVLLPADWAGERVRKKIGAVMKYGIS